VREARRLQRAVRLGVRALPHHVRQHRAVRPAHRRTHLAPDRGKQHARGPLAGLAHVDVRIGVVAGHDRRQAHDVVVDVGVHVERDADRRARVDGADAPQQLALAVLVRARDHRAVQVEQDAVPAAGAHRIDDAARDRLERVVVDRAAGVRLAGDRALDRGALALRDRDESAERAAGAAVRVDRRGPGEHAGPVAEEALERRGHRREGIGLVLELREQQAHGAISSDDGAPRGPRSRRTGHGSTPQGRRRARGAADGSG
jgi:hypothetical protein